MACCRRLLKHSEVRAALRALANAGNKMEISSDMMLITTNNSMSVKPRAMCGMRMLCGNEVGVFIFILSIGLMTYAEANREKCRSESTLNTLGLAACCLCLFTALPMAKN